MLSGHQGPGTHVGGVDGEWIQFLKPLLIVLFTVATLGSFRISIGTFILRLLLIGLIIVRS
jgi:hypothetical protein